MDEPLFISRRHPPPVKTLSRKSVVTSLLTIPLILTVCYLPLTFMANTGEQQKVVFTDYWNMLSLEYGSSVQSEIYRFIKQTETGLSDAEEVELARLICDESQKYDCDPKLILALIMVESSFYPDATSPKGARGLMQLRPHVAEALAQEVGIEWIDESMIYDPGVNIKLGLYYLSRLILQFKDLKVAITAYNFGPTYIQERLKEGKPLPVRYANKVLRQYRTLSQKDFTERYEPL